MSDDVRIRRLLEEVLDSGRTPEDVCQACPELLPEVRARLARLRTVEANIGELFPSSDSTKQDPPTEPDLATDCRAPAQIGPYRVVRQIGRGGQATVHLATHVRLHRQVALKVLDPGHAIDPTGFQRFRREAEITSKLDHPGICTVFESGEDGGVLWIAMRYVEGESLDEDLGSQGS